MPLTSLLYTLKAKDTPPSSPPSTPPPAWMWPSCKHPRTHSFRSHAKTIASLFLDSAESSFTNSSARNQDCSDSFSTASEASATAAAAADDTVNAIVRGLRSDRLLFEPRAPTSSILEKKTPPPPPPRPRAEPFGSGVAVAFDSPDPYMDFRASMEEMVAAHGVVHDWDWLEAMLGWYLSANGKDTHGTIVAAFVDLVVAMAASRPSRGPSLRCAEEGLDSNGGGNAALGLR